MDIEESKKNFWSTSAGDSLLHSRSLCLHATEERCVTTQRKVVEQTTDE